MDNELKELIKSIKNRCLIFELICQVDAVGAEKLLPTLLKDLYQDAQEIVDNYCIVRDE